MSNRVQHLIAIVAVAAAYFLLGKLGLKLAFVNASVTAVWAPTGLALAALLICGMRVWPGVFVGAFLVNITTSGSLLTTLGIATGNTLEGIAGAWLVSRFANGRHCLNDVRSVFGFVFLAAGLSTTISATIGTASLAVSGFTAWANFVSVWLTWWVGDAVGAILVAPLLLSWAADPRLRMRWRRAPEGVLLFLTLVYFGLTVFGSETYQHPLKIGSYPLTFLAAPLLLWAVFRFGSRTAISATLLLSGIALWGTLHEQGPFAMWEPNESLLLTQLFMGVLAVTIMVIAATYHQLEQFRRRLETANAELLAASLTDALTGASNRRGFDQRLSEELERAARFKQPLSVLLLDVDKFKRHNDTYGHAAGDEVLKSVVRLLQAHVRATDTVARQGGDEFAIILPNTEVEGALIMAERFRKAIETAPWRGHPVTVTVGTATLPVGSNQRGKLLAQADEALYAAKEAGRNRVMQAGTRAEDAVQHETTRTTEPLTPA